MKRRDFFLAGISLGFMTKVKSLAAYSSETGRLKKQSTNAAILGAPGFIDKNRLRGRNGDRSTVVCRQGVAATSQPVAATIGVDILKAGGNAIDAAVAMSAMMAVVEPMSCGPGGDLFAIAWIEKEKKLYGLNASGRSPFAWNRDEAKNDRRAGAR